jgi:hypothetical protein
VFYDVHGCGAVGVAVAAGLVRDGHMRDGHMRDRRGRDGQWAPA